MTNTRRITLDGQDGVPAPAKDVDAQGVARIRHVPTPALEVFPVDAGPSKGTVLVCPGGGYGHLAIGYEGIEVAAMLNAAGWDAAVLLYRVSEGAETRARALEDATAALTLLQGRGGEFGLSTTRIGALGFSAGGHLVARLAQESAAGGGAGPVFLVLLYPAYLEKDGTLLDDVAPTGAPIFLCVGDRDHTYLPSSQALAAACQAKGVRCEYIVAPDAGHGFGLQAKLPGGAGSVPEALRAFLDSLSGGQG